jgi:hypothetical protein
MKHSLLIEPFVGLQAKNPETDPIATQSPSLLAEDLERAVRSELELDSGVVTIEVQPPAADDQLGHMQTALVFNPTLDSLDIRTYRRASSRRRKRFRRWCAQG